MSEKACTVCKLVKPLAEYSINRARKDGLHYVCRPCVKLKDAAYKDRKNELRAQRAAANAEKPIDPLALKCCTRCNLEKPHTAFHRANREVDGLQSICARCTVVVGRAYRELHPERGSARHAAYRATNKERINAQISQWQKDNREKCRAKSERFRLRNADRERARQRNVYARHAENRRESTRQWRSKNPQRRKDYEQRYVEENRGLINAKTARRRAAKRQATPSWADQNEILEFYKEAARLTAETGVVHHVDHIVPLISKLVCGLHTEANLQVITGSENSQKHNSFWPGMPSGEALYPGVPDHGPRTL